MPWPLIISVCIFAASLGFAARKDDGFGWWKPLVLAIALVVTGWGLGRLVMSSGNTAAIWIAATALFGVAGTFAVRLVLKTAWLHAVIAGVTLVLLDFGIQKAWEYMILG